MKLKDYGIRHPNRNNSPEQPPEFRFRPRNLRITDEEVADEEWLRMHFPPKVRGQPRRRRRVIQKKRKKHLTMHQREGIIVHRFRILGTMDRIDKSMKWISAKMGIIYSTVVRIVKNYKLAGCVINYFADTWERKGKNCKLTQTQMNWVTNINTLKL